MKLFKKFLPLTFLIACLVTPLFANADDSGIATLTATATTRSVTVSGTVSSDMAAVMVAIADSNDTILNLYSLPVDLENRFSGTITEVALTAGANYRVKVADYSGGEWKVIVVTVPQAQTNTSSRTSTTTSTSTSGSKTSTSTSKAGTSTSAKTGSSSKTGSSGKTSTNTSSRTGASTATGIDTGITAPVEPEEKDVIFVIPGVVNAGAYTVTKKQVSDAVYALIEILQSDSNELSSMISEETALKLSQALTDGKEIMAEVYVKPVEPSVIPNEDKSKIMDMIDENKESNIVLAYYLDLSIMLKTSEGEELGTYDGLSEPITLTIPVPEEPACPEGSEYIVLRVHNGVTSVLPTRLNDDGTLSFDSDEFSTYALAVREVITKDPDSPADASVSAPVSEPIVEQTVEPDVKKTVSPIVFVVVGIILLAGITVLVIVLVKKNQDDDKYEY